MMKIIFLLFSLIELKLPEVEVRIRKKLILSEYTEDATEILADRCGIKFFMENWPLG